MRLSSEWKVLVSEALALKIAEINNKTFIVHAIWYDVIKCVGGWWECPYIYSHVEEKDGMNIMWSGLL